MAKVYSKCNYCGVPESQWVNGKCIAYGRGIYCDMREEDIIEQRVYDWFVRRGVVNNGAISFGGINAVMLWWRDAILKRKDVIEQICCHIYQQEDVAHWEKPKEAHPYLHGEMVECEWNREKYKRVEWQGIDVAVFPDTKYKIPELDYSTRFSLCTCDIDIRKDFGSDAQGKASIWFLVMPSDWKQLEALANCEVPKIVKGWNFAEIPYAGNSILDATDAVAEIEHPFNVMRHRSDDPYSKAGLGRFTSFSVLVGFSKRRFKELLKKGENLSQQPTTKVAGLEDVILNEPMT